MQAADCQLCQRHRGFITPEPTRECIHTCIGCGFWSERVECSGIYYCPNPLCRACGVTNTIIARCKREGVQVVEDDNGFSVDEDELRRVQQKMVREISDDALLTFLREKYPTFMSDLAGAP